MAARSAYVSDLKKNARFVAIMSRCVLSAVDTEGLPTSPKMTHKFGKIANTAVPQVINMFELLTRSQTKSFNFFLFEQQNHEK